MATEDHHDDVSEDEREVRQINDRNQIGIPADIADKFDDGQRFWVSYEGGKVVLQPVKVEPILNDGE